MEELIRIFGKNLYDETELLESFKELTGISNVKPFECVGTIDEVNFSLINTIRNHSGSLPYLLEYYKSTSNFNKYGNSDILELNRQIDNNHFLNEKFLKILKSALIDK